MMRAVMDKPLVCLLSFGFPTPVYWPIFAMRRGNLTMGQGHNATTVQKPTVVPTVVGYFPWQTRVYTQPTTPQRQIAHSLVCTCAPAYAIGIIPLWALWRCAFFYLFENQEKYRKKGHNGPHNGLKLGVVGLVKSLKNLNKGGFCRG